MFRKLARLAFLLALGWVCWVLLRSDSAEPRSPRRVLPTRCRAVKQDGERCSRDAEPGSHFCWQHQAEAG